MTKAELIEALNDIPDDVEISLEDSEYGAHYLERVEIDKNEEGYVWGVTLS